MADTVDAGIPLIKHKQPRAHISGSSLSTQRSKLDWLTILLRTHGLPILSKSPKGEEKLPAIRKSRPKALLQASIHLVPVIICIFLLILNLRSYYLGKFEKWNSAFQFAAKLHELSMQASIAIVVLAYIRWQLTMIGSLPFGALFSMLQATQPSYLWSQEFIASTTATCFQSTQR